MSTAGSMEINLDFLRKLSSTVTELDAKLDRSTGSLTTHKNTVEKELAQFYHEQFSENVSRVVDWAQEELTGEQRAGFYSLLTSALENAFGKEVDALLEQLAKKRAEEAVPLSEEEEKSVREERKKVADQYKAAAALMKQWGFDVDSVPAPKARRGAPAGVSRGPRQLSRFDYKINGFPIASEKNGLGPIASTVFGVKVSVLKDMVKEASEGKFDLSQAEELPDEWEVSLVHPQTNDEIKLFAARQEEFREEDDDEETEVSDEVSEENTENEQEPSVAAAFGQ